MPGTERSKGGAYLTAFRLMVALLAATPFFWLVYRVMSDQLGPDPGQEVTESLGLAAFQLLLVTLLMTPLRRWTGWGGWLRVRRMLGLFCFFYATLHVLAFLQFILGWGDLWTTFTKRPYILAGLAAFTCLLILALTSPSIAMRRLGPNWKRLHRLVYPAVIIAWVHFVWQARSDIGEMVAYGVVILLLLGFRAHWFGWSSLVPLKKR